MPTGPAPTTIAFFRSVVGALVVEWREVADGRDGGLAAAAAFRDGILNESPSVNNDAGNEVNRRVQIEGRIHRSIVFEYFIVVNTRNEP
mmetsp:Transcript_13277/g.29362  ORF Transcript_13277/g.29362 Transcript_13277/m.29362 type:complete len:89 (-) Transcript_13277:86-352(-)